MIVDLDDRSFPQSWRDGSHTICRTGRSEGMEGRNNDVFCQQVCKRGYKAKEESISRMRENGLSGYILVTTQLGYVLVKQYYICHVMELVATKSTSRQISCIVRARFSETRASFSAVSILLKSLHIQLWDTWRGAPGYTEIVWTILQFCTGIK